MFGVQTIVRFVHGGDAAFRQISFSAYYYYYTAVVSAVIDGVVLIIAVP